jgi:hypothetical protein
MSFGTVVIAAIGALAAWGIAMVVFIDFLQP